MDTRAQLGQLTARELGVLRCMAEGLSNTGIGQRLHLSAKTVEVHVGAIFSKLGLYPDTTDNRRVMAVVIWLHQSRPAEFAA